MKKALYYLLSFSALLMGLSADGAAAAPAAAPETQVSGSQQTAGPRVRFESTVYEFGKVKSGETARHDFVFTNAGAAVLEILDVKPGCGCTTAGTWDKKVEPGKTGVIPLQFNSTGFSGMVAKTATVTCNDPALTNVSLQIRGTVWKPVDVSPSMAVFTFSSEVQTNETKKLRVVSNIDGPITLSDLQCTNASFQAELKTLKEGKEFELLITAIPSFTNQSTWTTISFKTSSAEAPVVTANAYVAVQPVLTAVPQHIMLPPAPLSNSFTATVAIRNSSTNSVVLSEPRLENTEVALELKELQLGQVFNLVASFPPGFKIPLGQSKLLTLKSNNPRMPVIRIPVFHSQFATVQTQPAASAPRQSVSVVSQAVPTRVAPKTAGSLDVRVATGASVGK